MFDRELTDAEKIVELNKLISFNHRTIDDCIERMAEMEKDAAIGRLVRAKFTSGNSISVPRITLDRNEVFKDEA
jgi:hypothetical protein